MRAATLMIGALLGVTTVAGCASGTTDASTAASTTSTPAVASTGDPTPSVSATHASPSPTTSTPAVLSLEKAAQRYLEIVRPYNEALEKLEQAVNGGKPLETQTAMAADTAEALESEIADLRSTAWPTEIRTSVDDLVAVSENALEHWRQAADAQSRDDLVNAALAAGEFDGTDAASAIREHLGIDPYDEGDY